MYPFRSTSVALLHEAHSSLDACAGCRRAEESRDVDSARVIPEGISGDTAMIVTAETKA